MAPVAGPACCCCCLRCHRGTLPVPLLVLTGPRRPGGGVGPCFASCWPARRWRPRCRRPGARLSGRLCHVHVCARVWRTRPGRQFRGPPGLAPPFFPFILKDSSCPAATGAHPRLWRVRPLLRIRQLEGDLDSAGLPAPSSQPPAVRPCGCVLGWQALRRRCRCQQQQHPMGFFLASAPAHVPRTSRRIDRALRVPLPAHAYACRSCAHWAPWPARWRAGG